MRTVNILPRTLKHRFSPIILLHYLMQEIIKLQENYTIEESSLIVHLYIDVSSHGKGGKYAQRDHEKSLFLNWFLHEVQPP